YSIMMLKSLCCAFCLSLLQQPEDGHDLCPSCLGAEHLFKALSEVPASIVASCPGRSGCSAVKKATDWMVAAQQSLSPLGQVACLRRPAVEAHSAPGKRAILLEPMGLSTKVRTPMPLREVQRSRCQQL
ncbi:hypothetical protein GOODEAATRI_020898, partial [Goodea atripinnis]